MVQGGTLFQSLPYHFWISLVKSIPFSMLASSSPRERRQRKRESWGGASERDPKVWWFMAVCLRAGSAATLVADEKNMSEDISSQLSYPITHARPSTNTLPSTSSAPISVCDRRRAGALSRWLDSITCDSFDLMSLLPPTCRLSERLKGNCVTLAWRGGSRFVSERGRTWDGGCVRMRQL